MTSGDGSRSHALLAGRRRRTQPSGGRGRRCAALAAGPALLLAGATVLPATAGQAAEAASGAGPALAVDATADHHPISPDIYGLNFADPALATELRLPVDRWGGNRATRYNYLNNTSNSGSDWYYLSHPEDQSADEFVAKDRAAGAKTVMTVPIIGRISKAVGPNGEHQCSFSVAKYGRQQDAEGWHPDCGNGTRPDGSLLYGNDPNDTTDPEPADFAGGMVHHLVDRYGDAAHGGVGVYQLDNEPALWQWTHRDIHPQRLGYDELWTKTQQQAAAVKAADPTAATLGPSDWGWCAYFFAPVDDPNYACATGPDRQAHGDVPLAEWYLAQARAYQQRTGVRLLDYFDEHYYPQANQVALNRAGDAATQALRLRTTRSLWDPSYQDESWIPDHVMLIPRMRDWVARNYPGTKLAITEYNFGGLESINGALTQADVLGIFAREGVDLATLWDPPHTEQPGAYALRMYRNYDGHGGSFGDTWDRATSTDQGKVAVYAATRRYDGAITALVVNKTGDQLTSPITIANADTTRPAQVWRYTAANPNAIQQDPDVSVAGGTAQLTLPANSLTMLVLPPAPHGTAPAAPTGVTATAGDGQATVTWTGPSDDGGSPITSYTVTAHHDGTDGPSTTRAGYPPATTATLSGLTNGTPYTFTVTATNTVGSGPASDPSPPVTPIGKPGAPTGVTAAAGNQTALVTWTPPADSGGSPITGYTVTAQPGGITATTDGAARSLTVPGLTNGTPYTVTVTATNTVGTGPPSTPSDPVIPATSPDQTVRVTLTPDRNPSPVGAAVKLTVAVSKGDKPATPGGVAVWDDTAQHYAAYDCPADTPSQSATAITYTCTATFTDPGPHTLIANWDVFWPDTEHGQTLPYTLQVAADAPPVTPPAAPTNVTATAGNGTATVTWTAPTDTGGAPITGYTVTAHHDGTDGPTRAATATTATLDGLTNGTAYTFTVTATNTAGTGPVSVPSPPVTPATPPEAPGAPTGVTATAGNGQATVTWTAPTDTGGAPITGYTVTAHHDGTDGPTRAATATTATLDGLTIGTAYTFTVTATNTAGTGPASAPSPPVTPGPSDAAPHVVILDSHPNPSPLGGTVQFTVAVSTGEQAAEPGGVSIWDETSPHYLAYGCPLDTPSQAATAATYTCTGTFDTPGPHQLTASYDVFWPVALHGQSPSYTQQVEAEQPQPAPPAPPTNVTASVVGELATVTWTAPPDGGNPITSYQIIAHHDGRNEPQEPVTGTPLTPRIDVRLSPGTAYTFTVLATNAAGTSPASAASPPVTAEPPPTIAITSKPANPTNTRTGTVEFTVSRPAPTSCQLDTATPAPCTSPVSYPDLAEGAHRVTVTATDTSGRGSATAEWTVDLTPPTVRLTARPPTVTNSRAATFGFTVTEPATTTCQLDNTPPAACTSPRSYTNLTGGRHTVTITANDTAGNRAAPAVVSWTVDLTAPTVALTAPATGATSNPTATVKWTGTDAPAGIASYDVSMQRYTLAGQPEPVSYPLTNTPLTATTLTLTAGKTTCLRVRAHDQAGNTSAWTTPRCLSVPADERALAASTGWTRVTKTGYYTDTYTWTAHPGATMTTPTSKVAKAWLVATRCPGCGTVGIYLGTTQVGAVNLNAITTQRAAILPAYAGTPRSGLLTLKVLTSGKRVELDGLALAPQ